MAAFLSPADVCANCGQEGGASIRLKNCTACYLVKYCSIQCQKFHREQHKWECRKRAAELKDEALFSQGHECSFGDCPICMLPLPPDMTSGALLNTCCMNYICCGCGLAAYERGTNDVCAFCREPGASEDAVILDQVQRRVDASDAEAMLSLGQRYLFGQNGLQTDETRGMQLLREAANLNSVNAHFHLGLFHATGDYGAEKDVTRAMHHYEIAAKAGHPGARTNLGVIEEVERMNYGRALKHYMIAAKMGKNDALGNIQDLHKIGHATKEEYAEALIGYQQAAEEMKSDLREKFKVFKAQNV